MAGCNIPSFNLSKPPNEPKHKIQYSISISKGLWEHIQKSQKCACAGIIFQIKKIIRKLASNELFIHHPQTKITTICIIPKVQEWRGNVFLTVA
jgi:hypothetical protein